MLTAEQQELIREKAREVTVNDALQDEDNLRNLAYWAVEKLNIEECLDIVCGNDEELYRMEYDFDPATGEPWADED